MVASRRKRTDRAGRSRGAALPRRGDRYDGIRRRYRDVRAGWNAGRRSALRAASYSSAKLRSSIGCGVFCISVIFLIFAVFFVFVLVGGNIELRAAKHACIERGIELVDEQQRQCLAAGDRIKTGNMSFHASPLR